MCAAFLRRLARALAPYSNEQTDWHAAGERAGADLMAELARQGRLNGSGPALV